MATTKHGLASPCVHSALADPTLLARLQLVADLVRSENIEYAGLDGAFMAHCRLRRWQGFGLSSMIQDT